MIHFPNILCTLTWRHSNPADTPTIFCINAISTEDQVDGIAFACYGRRQVGQAATPFHQDRAVTVSDCQVVVGTGERAVVHLSICVNIILNFNVKCSEL